MGKTILIGEVESGKTTLIQALQADEVTYKKTQAVEHYINFIDTPGEYIEHRNLYRALIITAADADYIGLVQSCTSQNSWLPPSFAGVFPKPVFGIVTKADLAADSSDIERATNMLITAGAGQIFVVSARTGDGLTELAEFLASI